MPSNLALSVVVPVYNKEESLQSCVQTLTSENARTGEFEIVLVNDGSTDNSPAICEQLAARYSNLTAISQENQGVSAARNAGVAAAQGEYVLFVDADDELTAGSIDALIAACREFGDQVDLITYPIEYYNKNTGSSHGHKREHWFKNGTGVYSLAEFPHLAQTTMNVCARRQSALDHPFSRTLKMGEDQLFNTTIVVEKGAIGFCADATYRYIQGGQGASKGLGNKPLYAFDQMLELYSSFVALAQAHPESAAYCYEMVLYNFWWRCSSGSLFPDFGTSEERAANRQRLDALVDTIPQQAFYDSAYLTAGQKAYLLRAFDRMPEGLTVGYGKKRAAIKLDGETLWRSKLPFLKIIRAVASPDSLQLMGYIFCNAFGVDPGEPTLFMKRGGTTTEVPLRPSSYGIKDARELTTRSWYFDLAVPLDGSGKTLTFNLKMGEKKAEFEKIVKGLLRSNARKGTDGNTLYFASCNLTLEQPNKLVISGKAKTSDLRETVRDFKVSKEFASARRDIRHANAKAGERPVWLYADLPSSASVGNALVQILHDVRKNDGVDRWFITEHGDELVAKHPELAGHVVAHQSHEHLLLYMRATMVLASYLDLPTFLPIPRAQLDYLGDLSRPKTFVYLQHGILHAHMPTYFSYDRKPFDYEVISTEFERKNLTEQYYFPEDRLICSGAPRLDLVEPDAKHLKKIIYAPSWRSYLVGGTANAREAQSDDFLNSLFFKGMMAFLAEVDKLGFLRELGYTLDLKLHPNFMVYRDYLPSDYANINIASDNVNESDYAIVITDYSSYVYDFYYAGSQVLYFLPDRREFEGGANHYSKLDFDFEEGLGPFAEQPEEAARVLGQMVAAIEAGEPPAHKPTGIMGGEHFFFHKDHHNAERLYDALMNLAR